MTASKLIPASVVTPHKVHRDRKVPVQVRLLNRALGLSSRTTSIITSTSSTIIMSPHSNNKSNGLSSPDHKNSARVFRCLSNTAERTKTTSNSSILPSRRVSLPPEVRLSRRPSTSGTSSLKGMFQPPRSPPQRSQASNQEPTSSASSESFLAFFGSRLDRSTLRHQSLRCSKPCAAFSDSDSEQDQDASRKKTIRFQPSVSVVKIPSHRHYSTQLKRGLWASMKEIKANAIRNTAEYIYDKCNWRNATEEGHMYRDTRSGNLIHPVHVQRYYKALQKAHDQKRRQQQQQEKKDSAQPASSSDENLLKSEESKQEAPQNEELQPPQPPPPPSRKRVRCCSPSPIRRRCLSKSERHEPKRPRIQSPVPMRRPRSVFYQHPLSPPYPGYYGSNGGGYDYGYYPTSEYEQQQHPRYPPMMMMPTIPGFPPPPRAFHAGGMPPKTAEIA